MQPKISVIVPVYKVEKYLHRCIDSILAQTFTDFELLLINDGSPDNCGSICDEYATKDNRIRVFHKENGGVSSARNLGLDNARGKYVTFCDADDYVGEDWLNIYDNAIIQGLDLAIQGFFNIKNKTEIEIKKLFPYNGIGLNDKQDLIIMLFNKEVYGYPFNKLFHRQILEENNIRFDLKSVFREDAQFFSEYLEYVNSFVCIDKENYYYISPDYNKKYNGNLHYSLFPIFKSLDVIFKGNIPIEIYNIFYSTIKSCAIQSILDKIRLSQYHLDLYERMVITLKYNKDFKKKLVNSMILNSHRYPLLSRLFFKLAKLLTKLTFIIGIK